MELKITKGEAFISPRYSENQDEYREIITRDSIIIARVHNEHFQMAIKKEEAAANAALIAEAFNVANETGLTPRVILEQRNKLLFALNELLEGAPNADKTISDVLNA